VDALPVDESEGIASGRQVNQFVSQILLLQRTAKHENVRNVVFDHKDACCANN
jgi:hypothetical protein